MRGLILGCVTAAAVVLPLGGASSEPRDSIADIIKRGGAQRYAQGTLPPGKSQPPAPVSPPGKGPAADAPAAQPPARDPREGDAVYEQAQRLMKAIDSILNDAARHRGEARKLPSTNDFLVRPLFTDDALSAVHAYIRAHAGWRPLA